MQTLLANHNSLGFPPSDVSSVIIIVNVVDVVVATTITNPKMGGIKPKE
jgi:hypothetical protein